MNDKFEDAVNRLAAVLEAHEAEPDEASACGELTYGDLRAILKEVDG